MFRFNVLVMLCLGALTSCEAPSPEVPVSTSPLEQAAAALDDVAMPTPGVVAGLQHIVQVTPRELLFGNQRVGTVSAAQVVRVLNFGSRSAQIEVFIRDNEPFTVSPNTPFTLLPGQSRDLSVRFQPVAPGTGGGTLILVTDDPGNPNPTVFLVGTGIKPVVTLDKSELNFGAQRVGTSTAPPQTVTVTNVGTDALQVSNVAVGSGQPFTVTPTSFTLVPNASTTLSVTFTPTSEGAAAGTMTLTTDDLSNPNPTVALTGMGVKPTISLSTTALTFAEQRVGTASSPQTVTVSNTGTGTLQVSSVSLPVGSQFAVAPTTAFTLAPGAIRSLAVTYTPMTEGPTSDTLTLVTSDPVTPSTVSLSGTGVRPNLQVSPTSLGFGNQPVGTPSPAQTVEVLNTGTGPVSINGVSTTSSAFTVTPATAFTLQPNQSQQLSVVFSPSTRASVSAELRLTTDEAAPSSAPVALSGTGVTVLELDPVSGINFGNVPRNQTATRTVKLTNASGADLQLTSVSPVGSPFSVTGLVPGTLAARATVTFEVNFTPTNAGAFNTVLSVQSDAVNSPMVLSLMGAGVQSELKVSRSSIFFGNRRVGAKSSPVPITVNNTGNTDVTIQNLPVLGDFDVVLPQGNALPRLIPAQSSFTFDVVFNPRAQGPLQGAVSVISDIPDSSPLQVSLEGNGTISVASLSLATLDFASQPVTVTSGAQPVIITNTGTAELEITELAVSNPAFVVLMPRPWSLPLPTPAEPLRLAVGEQTAVYVAFTPSTLGATEGKLFLISNAFTAPEPVTLKGVGVDGQTGSQRLLSVAPGRLDFGEVELDAPVEPQVLTVTNRSAQPQQAMVTFESSEGSPFLVDAAGLAEPIPPEGSATFKVTFQPRQEGEARTELQLWLEGQSEPEAVIPVTGRGAAQAGGCACGTTDAASAGLLSLLVLAALSSRRRRRT